ncbi:hypothetical protein CY34DRAFT_797524 [Suillus luteus UH-Slu-Lm8-n1]|uniref:Uncharacterized protein n=1 Tax=Suillus luteus UH-Slu-Lm8-n1 TaxID=930992 RepID=A0A0D0C2K2_9AGAM|nr:hypothetical protein CY34DRAFT_797524 [Suillus luteus UH-Slu-Lm8-n1]
MGCAITAETGQIVSFSYAWTFLENDHWGWDKNFGSGKKRSSFRVIMQWRSDDYFLWRDCWFRSQSPGD